MGTSENTNSQSQEEEKEEALSLRDLPINTDQPISSTTTTTTEDHRDSSTELFEFLTSTSHDVSPAENIIFDGKVIPLNYQNALLSPPEDTSPRVRARSESLSALRGNKLNVPTARDNAELMRTSRSLNHCKLTRVSATVHSSPENSSSAKNTAKNEATSGKSVRPRWYVIMFGMVKFPPEVELKDIKSRQIRRNIPPVMFPSPVKERSRSPSPSPSWKFLNALSCKEPTSVAATAPFRMSYA